MGLKEARGALAELVSAALGPDADVFDHVPNKITPPVAIIRPADDYVGLPVDFAGGRVAQLEIVLVAKSGRNNLTSDDLDDMIDAVLAGLVGSGIEWDAPVVPAPFVAEMAGSNFLACALQTACVYH